jgi:anaerobic magnesium-protoporphyrin IX monomethyl ester cyclase
MTASRPRLLLVTPPYHSGVVEAAGVWLPLNLVYVAGHARAAGADVEIYDAMSLFHTHQDIARTLGDLRPDIVAVTAMTATEPDAREVCATAKRLNPRTLTVLGNVHPTFCWEDILRTDPNVDVIVCGEGEVTIEDLVRAVAAGGGADTLAKIPGIAWRRDGRPWANPPRPFVPDLDELLPAFDLLDWSLYRYFPRPEGHLAIVSSSRGCRAQCSFCSQQKFWQRSWRGRRPEAFVAELELLRDRYGVRVAMLADETPTVEPARWEHLLDLLIERQTGVELLMETRVDDIVRDEAILPKYRAAGVSHIYVGVEATRQATLDLFHKETLVGRSKQAIDLINRHGIVSETSFVLGTLDETPASINETLELATWYGPDMAFFLALTPWPYADIYPLLKDHIVTTDYRHYNLVEPVVKPEQMTIPELRDALHRTTGLFFRDRLRHLGDLPEEKRRFLVTVMKILVERSYLGAEMRAMASHAAMPEEVRLLLSQGA